MDRGVLAGRGFAAAEAFDEPDRFDTGFGRGHFGDRALPLGANFMAIVAGAIDAFGGELRRRHGRVLGELAVFFEQRVDLVFDLFFAFGVEDFFGGQEFLVERDGIALLPIFALLGGNVVRGIVLGVAAAAEGFSFDKDGAFAGAGAFDGFLGGRVHGHCIVTIHDIAGDAVGLGAVGQIFDGHLAAHGRRIG